MPYSYRTYIAEESQDEFSLGGIELLPLTLAPMESQLRVFVNGEEAEDWSMVDVETISIPDLEEGDQVLLLRETRADKSWVQFTGASKMKRQSDVNHYFKQRLFIIQEVCELGQVADLLGYPIEYPPKDNSAYTLIFNDAETPTNTFDFEALPLIGDFVPVRGQIEVSVAGQPLTLVDADPGDLEYTLDGKEITTGAAWGTPSTPLEIRRRTRIDSLWHEMQDASTFSSSAFSVVARQIQYAAEEACVFPELPPDHPLRNRIFPRGVNWFRYESVQSFYFGWTGWTSDGVVTVWENDLLIEGVHYWIDWPNFTIHFMPGYGNQGSVQYSGPAPGWNFLSFNFGDTELTDPPNDAPVDQEKLDDGNGEPPVGEEGDWEDQWVEVNRDLGGWGSANFNTPTRFCSFDYEYQFDEMPVLERADFLSGGNYFSVQDFLDKVDEESRLEVEARCLVTELEAVNFGELLLSYSFFDVEGNHISTHQLDELEDLKVEETFDNPGLFSLGGLITRPMIEAAPSNAHFVLVLVSLDGSISIPEGPIQFRGFGGTYHMRLEIVSVPVPEPETLYKGQLVGTFLGMQENGPWTAIEAEFPFNLSSPELQNPVDALLWSSDELPYKVNATCVALSGTQTTGVSVRCGVLYEEGGIIKQTIPSQFYNSHIALWEGGVAVIDWEPNDVVRDTLRIAKAGIDMDVDKTFIGYTACLYSLLESGSTFTYRVDEFLYNKSMDIYRYGNIFSYQPPPALTPSSFPVDVSILWSTLEGYVLVAVFSKPPASGTVLDIEYLPLTQSGGIHGGFYWQTGRVSGGYFYEVSDLMYNEISMTLGVPVQFTVTLTKGDGEDNWEVGEGELFAVYIMPWNTHFPSDMSGQFLRLEKNND